MPSVRTVVFLVPRWTIRAACLWASQELAGGPTSLVETWRRLATCNTMQKRRKEYSLYAESLATDIEKSHSRKKGVIWRPTGALVAADR